MSLHVNLLIYLETVVCSTITIVINQHNWCSTCFSVIFFRFSFVNFFFFLNAYIYDLNRFSHSFINLWQYDIGPSVSFLDPTVSKSSEFHRFPPSFFSLSFRFNVLTYLKLASNPILFLLLLDANFKADPK